MRYSKRSKTIVLIGTALLFSLGLAWFLQRSGSNPLQSLGAKNDDSASAIAPLKTLSE